MDIVYRIAVAKGLDACDKCGHGTRWGFEVTGGDGRWTSLSPNIRVDDRDFAGLIVTALNYAYDHGKDCATDDTEQQKLVAFFKGDGEKLGAEGDYDRLSPADTAIRAMRRLLLAKPSGRPVSLRECFECGVKLLDNDNVRMALVNGISEWKHNDTTICINNLGSKIIWLRNVPGTTTLSSICCYDCNGVIDNIIEGSTRIDGPTAKSDDMRVYVVHKDKNICIKTLSERLATHGQVGDAT